MSEIKVFHAPILDSDAPYEVRFPKGAALRFHCLEDADTIANLFKAIDIKHTDAFEDAIVAAVFSEE